MSDTGSGAEVAQSRATVATPARGTEREDAGRSAPALGTASPACIIDLPSHVGTPATWRSRSHPAMTVCDRHADQYASAYDDDTRVDDWEPITEREAVGSRDIEAPSHPGRQLQPSSEDAGDVGERL